MNLLLLTNCNQHYEYIIVSPSCPSITFKKVCIVAENPPSLPPSLQLKPLHPSDYEEAARLAKSSLAALKADATVNIAGWVAPCSEVRCQGGWVGGRGKSRGGVERAAAWEHE